jgi:hypothetical protein
MLKTFHLSDVDIKSFQHFYAAPHFVLFVETLMVARWFIFRPKIVIWVHFGGPCDGICWCNLWTFGLFYGQLVYFTASWSILRQFGIFCGHLVYFVAIWSILWPFGVFNGHMVYVVAIGYM